MSTKTAEAGAAGSPSVWSTIALALPVFALALITRTGFIGLPPIYDELYQMLPAQSWRLNGDFAVLDGAYTRAAIFTKLIAFSFSVVGEEGPLAGRLIPSVLPGALLVSLIFVWTRLVIGALAGWFVLVFLLLWPNGIEVSQYVRFYALHGLVFCIGVLAIYSALAGALAMRWRAALLILAAAALFFALRLQLLTMIGVFGLGLWVAVVFLPGWIRRFPWIWWLIAAGVALVAGVLASGVINDQLVFLWTTYQWQPWPAQQDMFFYHRNFRDNYPTFWPLFPVAALIALAAHPKAASLCLSLFTVGFILQSFGGLKGVRYLYPVMPFFFVLWAAALQAVGPVLYGGLRRMISGAAAPLAPARLVSVVTGAAVLGALFFLFAANAAFERSLQMTRGAPAQTLLGKTRWTWPAAAEMTRPWLEEGAVVVTSEEMLAVEWLGDFDLAYNKPRFSELLYSIGPDTPPFTADKRTGRPIIGEFDDLARVIACEPVGVVLGNAGFVGGGAALNIALKAQGVGAEVEASSRGGFSLVGWRRAPGEVGAECAAITPPSSDRAATRLLGGERTPALVSSSESRK
ncbi:MAG: hypothetical protein AAF360_01250 [Pseudomonadota bacterium]